MPDHVLVVFHNGVEKPMVFLFKDVDDFTYNKLTLLDGEYGRQEDLDALVNDTLIELFMNNPNRSERLSSEWSINRNTFELEGKVTTVVTGWRV